MLYGLAACLPDIQGLYDEERAAALAIASERPQAWHPDLAVQISTLAFEDTVEVALSSALDADLPPITLDLFLTDARLRPKFTAKKAKVRPSDACAACLAFDADLDGSVKWDVAGIGSTFPAALDVQGVLEVDIVEGRRLVARVHEVGRIDLKVKDLGELKGNPSKELQQWVRDGIRKSVPPIPITELDTAGIPARDLRVVTSTEALTLEVLTDVPGARAAAPFSPPAGGFQLLLSDSALTGLLRREAFAAGVVAYDVAIDPRAMTVEGSVFTLDLRLWRLVGTGWWRDYRITGDLAVADGRLALTPSGVEETGRSRGAELVDPLAVLAQGAILEGIARSIDRSLPVSRAAKVGDARVSAVVTEVRGQDQTLVVAGALRAEGKR